MTDEQTQGYGKLIGETLASQKAQPEPADLDRETEIARADNEGRRFTAKADLLKKAIYRSAPRDEIFLPALSAAAGSKITVKVKRLTPQQLLATDMLPQQGTRFLNLLIEKANENTRNARLERGMDPEIVLSQDDVETALKTAYRGESKALYEGFAQFVNVVCVQAVIDPDVRFFMTREEAEASPIGFWIEDIPDTDRLLIYEWAFKAEEDRVAKVAPFPHERTAPRRAVRNDEVGPRSPFDPDSV